MKRMLLLVVVVVGLCPAEGQGADYPIGFWRWMGYGIGPGYHAHNCCQQGPGHRPQIVPWHPHQAQVSPPPGREPGLVQAPSRRPPIQPTFEIQPQDDPWQAIRPVAPQNPLR